MDTRKIAILLSTYNGEKYLKEQIQSLINQDYKDWELFIRDDGSSDSTLRIIEAAATQHDKIHLIFDGRNMGAARSFLYLASKIDAPYYMFCDQDDIWLKDKISNSLALMKNTETNPEIPALVFSDAMVVTHNLEVIDDSFWHYNRVPPELILDCPEYISVFNCAPGCTMMFNRSLKKLLKDYIRPLPMHDWYAMITALRFGRVAYTQKPLLLYRQHSNNVLGAAKISLADRIQKIIGVRNSLKKQLELYRFVSKHTGISMMKFYTLKLKFNIKRFDKS